MRPHSNTTVSAIDACDPLKTNNFTRRLCSKCAQALSSSALTMDSRKLHRKLDSCNPLETNSFTRSLRAKAAHVFDRVRWRWINEKCKETVKAELLFTNAAFSKTLDGDL